MARSEQVPTASVRLSQAEWETIEHVFGTELPKNPGRIHLRYPPGALIVDPAFYGMGPPSNLHLERYFIEYDEDRTSAFEGCAMGLDAPLQDQPLPPRGGHSCSPGGCWGSVGRHD